MQIYLYVQVYAYGYAYASINEDALFMTSDMFKSQTEQKKKKTWFLPQIFWTVFGSPIKSNYTTIKFPPEFYFYKNKKIKILICSNSANPNTHHIYKDIAQGGQYKDNVVEMVCLICYAVSNAQISIKPMSFLSLLHFYN